jgi:superkiller protein 3
LYADILLELSALTSEKRERNVHNQYVVNFYSFLIDDIKSSAEKDFQGCTWISELLFGNDSNPYLFLRSYIKAPNIPASYLNNRKEAYSNLGNFARSNLDALEEAEQLKRSANSAIDFYNLGLAYAWVGENEEVIEAMKKAIELDNPGVEEDIADATDYFALGQAYAELSRFDEAIEALNKAINIQLKGNPAATAGYYRELGNVYRRTNRFDQAIEALNTALGKRFENDNLGKAVDWYDIGLTYHEWGKQVQDPELFQKAVDAFHQSIELDNPEETANNLDPDDAADWYNIGLTYYEWGKQAKDPDLFQKAVDAFHQSIELTDPDDAADWYNIGLTYYEWGKLVQDPELFQKAVDAFHQSIELTDPDDAADWYDIGLTYHEWGKQVQDPELFQKAVDAFHQSIELDNPEETANNLDPDDAADWYRIGETYHSWALIDANKKELAIDSVNQCLSIGIEEDSDYYIWVLGCKDLKQKFEDNN